MGQLGELIATWGPHGIGAALIYLAVRIDMRVKGLCERGRDHEQRLRVLEGAVRCPVVQAAFEGGKS